MNNYRVPKKLNNLNGYVPENEKNNLIKQIIWFKGAFLRFKKKSY